MASLHKVEDFLSNYSEIINTPPINCSKIVPFREPSFDRLRILMYYLYILLCDKAFFYTGITADLEKRLAEHRSKQSPHTSRYQTFELVYTESHHKRDSAERREKQIKGWSHEKKKALADGDLAKLRQLSTSKS